MCRSPPGAIRTDTLFPYTTRVRSPTGLYVGGDDHQSVEKKRVVLTDLTKKQKDLQNRVNLLDGRRVDPDLADEYVREKLGVMHPDEIAIPMDGNEKP